VGIRETLNKNPGITTGGAIAIIVIVGLVIVWQLLPSSGVASDPSQMRVFFSVDDGKTWFADSFEKLPPWDKDGKKAVRAHVFRGSDGKEFVGYLERFSPAGRARVEAALKQSGTLPPLFEITLPSDIEIKPPGSGDKGWISQNDPRAQAVLQVKSPTTGKPEIEPVIPN
jgi:hypothetical protein